jgi:hypothetical protein
MLEPVARRLSLAGAVALLSAALLLAAPLPAGAAATWSVHPSPNQGTNTNFLYDVSCATAKSCMAVGFYTAPNVDKTLTESWNGSAWKVVPSPSPGGVWNFLYDVDCRTATSCTAVGRYENDSGVNRTLIESWDGSAWALVPSPNNGTAPNILNGVSCASASFCVAVGKAQTGGYDRTVVETWNGSAWKITSSPNRGKFGNGLSDVDCASAKSCIAVGASVDVHGFARTLAETWNGATWQIVVTPDNGSTGNALTGVSCGSAKSCHAVGTYGAGANGKSGVPHTLVESWDGSAWSLQQSPNRSRYANSLARVSCRTESACKAVGWSQETSAGSRHTLVESLNGSKWVASSSPNPPTSAQRDNYLGVRGAALNGVSCVAAGACTAVGFYGTGFHSPGGSVDHSLVERYG